MPTQVTSNYISNIVYPGETLSFDYDYSEVKAVKIQTVDQSINLGDLLTGSLVSDGNSSFDIPQHAQGADLKLFLYSEVNGAVIEELVVSPGEAPVEEETTSTTDSVVAKVNTKMDEVINLIGDEVNAIKGAVGARSALQTVDKSTLVAALNEVSAKTNTLETAQGDFITTVDAEQKIATAKDAAITAAVSSVTNTLLGDKTVATATKDSISELITYFEGLDNDQQTALDQLVNGKNISYEAQTLTESEQAQARANIGAVSAAEVTSAAKAEADSAISSFVGNENFSNWSAMFQAKLSNPAI